MLRLRKAAFFVITFWVMIALCGGAHASISLLVEEPFGTFGAFNPTGHAAIYLDHVCAETPTRLRLCHPGELGSVVSRYHRVDGYDWVVIPLIPYLYAVEDLSQVPPMATPELRKTLRDRYRRQHLLSLAPNRPDGSTPGGEWIQLIGSSYDRRIFVYQMGTTQEQDEAIMARLNDSHNHGRFNLFYRNCADFARSILRSTYPGSIPRNTMSDFWLTTPKHLARLVTQYGKENAEANLQVFQIEQVPGTIQRSHRIDGIGETLVRSKKYIVPLAFLSPTTAASLIAAYVGTGRFHMPKDAPPLPALEETLPVLDVTSSRMQLPLQSVVSPSTEMCSYAPDQLPMDPLMGGN